ncbi:MAG TPA: NADH-quinone oxidoreductase subunit A [Longimicrobiaceae bacterium]|nr:NADH-quinone oxidoreductase subunit A [Longimicrobiaceae bacterium]
MAALAAALAVLVAGVASFLALRWAGDVLSPWPPSAPERVPFLGGNPPEVHAWSRFHVRYYAMALLFLAFDMEMVFMYPWAVVFVKEGMVALVEMLMFIAILLLGILYAWRERALEWA